jgi:hypothetical protein
MGGETCCGNPANTGSGCQESTRHENKTVTEKRDMAECERVERETQAKLVQGNFDAWKAWDEAKQAWDEAKLAWDEANREGSKK